MINDFLKLLKIEKLLPLQEEAVKLIQEKSNTIILSPTGSGKTIAFLIPLIKLLDKKKSGVQALILTPSRELALQIERVFKDMQTGFKSNACYGGHPFSTEVNNLKIPPALLIGTPGRISDHLRRNSFDSSTITTLILDEFDKSLEAGFKDEMEFIIKQSPNVVTRVLTSATAIPEIPEYTGIKNPVVLDYSVKGATGSVLKVNSVKTDGTDKLQLLFKLICFIGSETTIIFCNHREAVDRIGDLLVENGIKHGRYHGGMIQEKRELELIKFRNTSERILVTTDLASRGLDISHVSNIIHYQMPSSESVWIHRNGRTARMDKNGTAWIVLAGTDFIPEFIDTTVEEITLPDDLSIPKLPEYLTIYISAGKKEKISRADVAGFIIKKGLLSASEVGRIDVLDHASLVAVNRLKARELLRNISGQRLKNKAVKVEIAR